MNDAQLEAAIAAKPGDKVTKESIEARIDNVMSAVLPNSTVTIVNITMKNGFSIRGESACVDARNFDLQIGEEIAYRDAFRKIWELEGYLLAEQRHQDFIKSQTPGA